MMSDLVAEVLGPWGMKAASSDGYYEPMRGAPRARGRQKSTEDGFGTNVSLTGLARHYGLEK